MGKLLRENLRKLLGKSRGKHLSGNYQGETFEEKQFTGNIRLNLSKGKFQGENIVIYSSVSSIIGIVN